MGGSSSVRGDQTIYHTDNLCFDGTDRGSPMDTDGQLWIGATASDRADNGGHVRLGQLTSPLGTMDIGYSAPNITMDVPQASEISFGTVELASQVQSENGTYGTTQVLQVGNIDSMFATPSSIGSGTRNTALFTSLGSNAGQTFSAAADVFPSTNISVSSTGYSSNNQVLQLNMNGVVPASIVAGFGATIQMQAQNTAGNSKPIGSITAIYDTVTPGSEASHLNLAVSNTGDTVITGFSVYKDHVVLPKGQYVNVTTPGAYPYTTLISDYLILVDTSSARTITPLASPATGAMYVIKDNVGSAGTNNITVTPSGKNIDGTASKTISTNYGSMTIVYNGVQWNSI